jgi:branched-chain amino acid transport system permease protein
MRAAAVNPSGAELAGIPVARIQFGTYLAGGLLGGLAGIMILYSAGLDFTASLSLTLSGFGAAIIFGIASPLRCLLGGIAMGVAEALAAGYTSGMVTAMVPFLFVLIVLSLSNIGGGAMAGDRP